MTKMREVLKLTTDVLHCARCGEDHQSLIFNPFTISIVDKDGTYWSWWALCPTNGEPILLRAIEDEEQAK